MPIQQHIKPFYKQYVTYPDRVLLMLLVLCVIIGAVLVALNHFTFQYPIVYFPSTPWTKFYFMFFIGIIFYSMYVRKTSPRGSTFLWGLGFYTCCVGANLWMTIGVQGTPFPPIDDFLIRADQFMGVDTVALLQWTHNHPTVHRILNDIYDTIALDIILIPFVLMCFNARKTLGVLMISSTLALIIGEIIYYFFPTMAPSGLLFSPYFSSAEQHTSLRFYQLHHYLKITAADGGLIAFPSFHVIWAVLFTYACRAKKYFFYPVALVNLLLIISTVFLGWHYLTDVIAGFLIAFLCIYLAEKCYSANH